MMRVAIIDVGSNTMRLLVAARNRDVLEPLLQERAQVGLAEEIEHRGWISAGKMAEAAAHAHAFALQARALNCVAVEVVVTAPGRQAVNAEDLLVALQRATGTAPRVLSAEEEGRLAYLGAVATLDDPRGVNAVCDVGGGSTEIAVGVDTAPPHWVASIDIGSLRLTSRHLDRDAPGRRRVQAAAVAVAGLFGGIEPPCGIERGLAVGGSARALRKLVGRDLDGDALAEAIDLLTGRPAEKVAKEHGIGERRARTLLGGTIILCEAQRLLGVPLMVARAGLREGLAGELLAEPAAA